MNAFVVITKNTPLVRLLANVESKRLFFFAIGDAIYLLRKQTGSLFYWLRSRKKKMWKKKKKKKEKKGRRGLYLNNENVSGKDAPVSERG